MGLENMADIMQDIVQLAKKNGFSDTSVLVRTATKEDGGYGNFKVTVDLKGENTPIIHLIDDFTNSPMNTILEAKSIMSHYDMIKRIILIVEANQKKGSDK